MKEKFKLTNTNFTVSFILTYPNLSVFISNLNIICIKILPPRNNALDAMHAFNELDCVVRTLGGTNLQESVYTILSAILHLGNIHFENNELGYAVISSSESIKFAANLLAIDLEKLRNAFLKQKMTLGSDREVIFLYV